MTRAAEIHVTPVAFPDPPLLNSIGVHEPLALRTVIQVVTETGTVGWGEGPGNAALWKLFEQAADGLQGLSVTAPQQMEQKLAAMFPDLPKLARRRLFAPFEVACLDAQGKEQGIPVSALLGGAVRRTVPFSAYLFYKWAAHPGQESDQWGEVLNADAMVELAGRFIDQYGFDALKVKGGVFPPEVEVAALHALAEAFPDRQLRIDPNGAWTVATSIEVAKDLEGVLEYLEDPTIGIEGMSEVARATTIPLATNMCVVSPEMIAPAYDVGAVSIILSDHHYWGGLRHTLELGAVCDVLDMGLSMHSNSHLGISLAAMTHAAAATPNLTYSCDTHYPWNRQADIVPEGTFNFVDGSLAVADGPGLGIEIDEVRLRDLNRVAETSQRTHRDDTTYMRTVVPDFDPTVPRW